ncbi:GNAT family N-acetyltransferase [Roseomonas sp. CCTCC AB2023176]|uniref:GNAT family N-acetyltransferase n=1 Tax=Roseomonas sp. CCTCC AB2023176 TaxID=3342640 RepID=UPI0035DC0033
MTPVHAVTLPDGHVVSDDRRRLDMDAVHAALSTAYWSAGRPRAVTERAWAHSLPVVVTAPDGAVAGFARLVTDRALRAHLADVFVRPASRGLGLGRAMVDYVLSHPALATVTHWTLTTRDAHGLYARLGFESAPADPDSMTMVRRPAGQPGT